MSPLTNEERQFAADHHGLLYCAMRQQAIPLEYYDLAALAYLRAIKHWFSRPDLRSQYAFGTILAHTLRTDWGSYRRHQSKQLPTYSYDSPLPSGDGTFVDMLPDDSPSVEDNVSDLEAHLRQTLTTRETAILDYLLLGYKRVSIAEMIGCDRHTIWKNCKSIRSKTLMLQEA